MKITNIFISLFFAFIVGIQSISLVAVAGAAQAEQLQAVGAAGVLLALTLFLSAALSIEKPHVSVKIISFFIVFSLIFGVGSEFTDLLIYGVLMFIWLLFFGHSLRDKKEE